MTEAEHEETLRKYEAGDTNIVLYRLMKYLPSNPEKLYSPVGATSLDAHMGTTEFTLRGINKDIADQGFFAEASPKEAAAWFKYRGELTENNTIPSYNKDPFIYAIFPIAPGEIHNTRYFDEHPEVRERANFGIADGLIVDAFTIIGEPVAKWTSDYTEAMAEEDDRRHADYKALQFVMRCIQDPSYLRSRKSLSGEATELTDSQKQTLAEGAKRALASSLDIWTQDYNKVRQMYRYMTLPGSAPLEPTEANKHKIQIWIDANL